MVFSVWGEKGEISHNRDVTLYKYTQRFVWVQDPLQNSKHQLSPHLQLRRNLPKSELGRTRKLIAIILCCFYLLTKLDIHCCFSALTKPTSLISCSKHPTCLPSKLLIFPKISIMSKFPAAPHFFKLSSFILPLVYSKVNFNWNKNVAQGQSQWQWARPTYCSSYPITCLFSLSAEPVLYVKLIKDGHNSPDVVWKNFHSLLKEG